MRSTSAHIPISSDTIVVEILFPFHLVFERALVGAPHSLGLVVRAIPVIDETVKFRLLISLKGGVHTQ